MALLSPAGIHCPARARAPPWPSCLDPDVARRHARGTPGRHCRPRGQWRHRLYRLSCEKVSSCQCELHARPSPPWSGPCPGGRPTPTPPTPTSDGLPTRSSTN
eukprot:8274502-Pyramimonas_sp.AAC.2